MRTALLVILALGLLAASDYFIDYPSFLQLPEIWECPGRSSGFQFCS